MKNIPISNFIKNGITAAVITLFLTACGNEINSNEPVVAEVQSERALSEQVAVIEHQDVLSGLDNAEEGVVKSVIKHENLEQKAEMLKEATVESVTAKINDVVPTVDTSVVKEEKALEITTEAKTAVSKVIEKPVESVDVAKVNTTVVEKTKVDTPVVISVPVTPAFEPRTGVWTKKSQKIEGQWRIEKRADQAYLVLGSDFKTRKAPDLKLVLSNQAVSDTTNANAMQGVVLISPLKSPKGAQEYKLPEDFMDYKTLLLHCEKYTKLWGAADIQ